MIERFRKYDWLRPIVGTSVYLLSCLIVYCSGCKWISIGLVIAFIFIKALRYAVFNFDQLLISAIVNAFNYARYKEYNYPDMIGSIDCFVAHTDKVFGCCKTLSAVVRAKRIYDRYNGKMTFDYKCQNPHWITWQVRVISNVDIKGVPVEPFQNFDQLVKLATEDTDGILTVVVLDECNAVLNSRNFKSNFQNEEQIRSIVTCRHNNIYMMLVGQRFKYLDALVRNMSDNVIECVHLPLFNTVIHYVYSAYDLETCDNPKMIKRLDLRFNYIYQSEYKLYDTKALVGMIAKTPSRSSAEIVAQKGNSGSDLEAARHLSAKGKRLQKKALL